MNDGFVAIKVDREERPDLDSIYMDAVQQMTGSGGWPMSVFLTPDGKPFYGGTYFPDTPRHGLPSFRQVLDGVSQAWRERRSEVEQAGAALASAISGELAGAQAGVGAGRGWCSMPLWLGWSEGSTRGTAAGAARPSSRSR